MAFAIGALFIIITEAVTIMIGMSTIAHYYENDPIIAERISRSDEITPLLVNDQFSQIPGFTGIFLIATCSATLSSFSTFLSSSATVILPLVKKCMTIEDDVKCSKVLIVIIGLGTYFFAVGSSQLPNTLMGMLAAITMNIARVFLYNTIAYFKLRTLEKIKVLRHV